MGPQPNIAAAAFLIADPTRAAMLMSLLDGRAWPAGELAYAAGITAQTASSHLGKLLSGGLLSVETEGRHRYYRLAGPHVAAAIEHLSCIGPVGDARRKPLGREAQGLQFARCCYDHLAGSLSVASPTACSAGAFLSPKPTSCSTSRLQVLNGLPAWVSTSRNSSRAGAAWRVNASTGPSGSITSPDRSARIS